MSKSNIEWTQETWNPLTGCSRKSEGCKNCYAEKMTKRLEAMGVEKYQGLLNEHGRFNGKVRFDKNALMIPLKRKKPTTYFVNSMSDMFHENVSDAWRDEAFAIMALTPQHPYQVLTKRPDRMYAWFNYHHVSRDHNRADYVADAVAKLLGRPGAKGAERTEGTDFDWPLKNVWMGVSVEDQLAANVRIPLLLQTPAAVRFLSVEPLLDYVRIKNEWLEKLDWIIVGGESGANARLFNIEWIRPLMKMTRSLGATGK